MKRVLFVDDERAVLDGLRQMLEPQQGHWEMAFAEGGEEALTLMEGAPFDVIVSDVKMPGMDGAALLKKVCNEHPAAVRIVLSDQADLEEALRTVPVAHQFLVKPCDLPALRVAIERATSLHNVLRNKMLVIVVGSVKDLPVLPKTYIALQEKLRDPDAEIRDIVRLVEQDVGISAKILQLVNSAFFGLPREISTLRTAVAYLGIEIVHNLVLSAEVFRVFEKAPSFKGFSFEEMHVHSQLVAKIAGAIPASATTHNVAIVAGLLHDVGKLVLATRSPKHFMRALEGAEEDKKCLHLVEEGLMGVSHAEVGAYLLGIWGLPCSVLEAVAHHHQPTRVPQDVMDAVTIVHVANYLAHEHPVNPEPEGRFPNQVPDPEYLANLGIAEQLPAWHELAEEAANSLRGGGGNAGAPAPARPTRQRVRV
jgi:putative nucleotidyltransferase with HDIG domain